MKTKKLLSFATLIGVVGVIFSSLAAGSIYADYTDNNFSNAAAMVSLAWVLATALMWVFREAVIVYKKRKSGTFPTWALYLTIVVFPMVMSTLSLALFLTVLDIRSAYKGYVTAYEELSYLIGVFGSPLFYALTGIGIIIFSAFAIFKKGDAATN